MPGILGIFSGFWVFSVNFGSFLGTRGPSLAFSAFYLRVFGKVVGTDGHDWA
jgi:hypothetical protein